MTRKPLILCLAAAAALAGCSKENHNIVAGPEGEGDNMAANSAVTLPPAISASKTYRCADNSIVYVDWLTDGTARVKTSETDVGTSVKPGETPALKGDATAATISHNGKSCKA